MTLAPMNTAAIPELSGAAELFAMLAFRRPAWSKTERAFITRFLWPLGVIQDAFGNLYKRIGDAPILWSCHTDTVHTQGGKQRLSYSHGVVRVADTQSNCLGADCTAGVWLMMEMIRANKPGLYIFHRAEEVGGKGSSFIAKENSELLSGIKFAVAFDRRGTSSIITHQWGGRCCSDAFANSLSDELGMFHRRDDGGSFTDTANYVDLIGECSNLSVGYMSEHSKTESLDFNYLQELRNALLRIDTSKLVSVREPGEFDPGDEYDPSEDVTTWLEDDDDQEPRRSVGSMLSLVRDHPEEIADWLEEYGINADEVASAIYMRGGVIRKR